MSPLLPPNETLKHLRKMSDSDDNPVGDASDVREYVSADKVVLFGEALSR